MSLAGIERQGGEGLAHVVLGADEAALGPVQRNASSVKRWHQPSALPARATRAAGSEFTGIRKGVDKGCPAYAPAAPGRATCRLSSPMLPGKGSPALAVRAPVPKRGLPVQRHALLFGEATDARNGEIRVCAGVLDPDFHRGHDASCSCYVLNPAGAQSAKSELRRPRSAVNRRESLHAASRYLDTIPARQAHSAARLSNGLGAPLNSIRMSP